MQVKQDTHTLQKGERMQKLFRSLLAVGAVVSFAACGDDVSITQPAAGVVSVTVSPPAATLHVGDHFQLAADVVVNGSAATTVTWSTSNASVASVDGDGMVTAVAAGTASIIAASTVDANKKGAAAITVSASKGVQAISVNPSAVTVAPGANNAIGVAVSVTADPGVSHDFAISGGNASIATATKSGSGIVVTGVSATASVTTFTVASSVDATIATALVVTVRPPVPANVNIQAITFGNLNTPVNVANAFGQLDVAVNLTPNDETVTQLDVLVDNRVVASQNFSPSVQNAMRERSAYEAAGIEPAANTAAANVGDVIVLSFRSDSFNTTTGVANFLNGNHVVKAVANVAATIPTQRASNTYGLNFNNSDGFYVTMDNTAKNGGLKSIVSTGPAPGGGQEWRQGDVTVTSVPVVYTPTTPNGSTAKTVCTRAIAWTPGPASVGAPAAAVAVGTPAACLGGSQNATLLFPQGTGGYQSDPTQVVNGVRLRELPNVTGVTFTDGSVMLFNANAAFQNTVGGVMNAPSNAFAPAPAPPPLSGGLASGSMNQGFLLDNLSPSGTVLKLLDAPNNWINNNTVPAPNTPFSWLAAGITTRGTDGTGVGIDAASTDLYEYDDRAVAGVTWVAFTANPSDIPENPIDFTNNAYDARLTVQDMLHNKRTVNLVGNPSLTVMTFGVDATPPTIQFTDAGTVMDQLSGVRHQSVSRSM